MRTGTSAISTFILLAVITAATSCVPRLARAAWPPLGRPVCTEHSAQMHSVSATDATGGVFIAWQDLRHPKVNIFAQHVLPSGAIDAAWPNDGQSLLGDPAAMDAADGGQFAPVIVPDGTGGAVVAWLDLRSGATGADIFAQHVLASGVVDPAWPFNGTPLCVIEGQQNFLVMVADGEGGAIVAWVDNRTAADEFDIYAQHVLASGVVDPRCPVNGTPVCTVPGTQGFPAIVDDGAAGAIIAWHDARAGATGLDVFAQHVLSSGLVDPAWPDGGRAVCAAAGDQGHATLTTDGAQGAVVAWSDARVVGTSHIFAHHLLGSGAVDPVWPVNGRAISNAVFLETRALAVSDGVGGAIVNWQGFGTQLNIYVQHVTAAGLVDPAWPAGGMALSDADRQQKDAAIVADGAGGAIVAWEDSNDVVAQHVLASGTRDAAYPDAGRVVCDLPSKQGDISLVPTRGSGAIVSWTDGRSAVSADIYAMQVLEAGRGPSSVRTPTGDFQMNVLPNPFSGTTRISFDTGGDGPVDVEIFDVRGRAVMSFPARVGRSRDLLWDGRTSGGNQAPSGVYFCRISTPTGRAVRRLVLVR